MTFMRELLIRALHCNALTNQLVHHLKRGQHVMLIRWYHIGLNVILHPSLGLPVGLVICVPEDSFTILGCDL